MRCSSAVAHLIQGLMCSAFPDALLHTLVATSVYLSYHCLLVNMKQFGPENWLDMVVWKNPS